MHIQGHGGAQIGWFSIQPIARIIQDEEGYIGNVGTYICTVNQRDRVSNLFRS